MSSDVLIVGNPNSGKSLLFNRLTGLRQKVANFPGITTELRRGVGEGVLRNVELVDFPGIYSLAPLTKDERVAVEALQEALKQQSTKALLYVADATRLERSLFLLLQILPKAQALGVPCVVVVNLVDELLNLKLELNVDSLSQELGCPVVAVSARKKIGLDLVQQWLAQLPERATTLVTSATSVEDVSKHNAACKIRARDLSKRFGPKTDVLLKSQEHWDHWVLNTWIGPVVFFGVMLLLFQSIFWGAAPLMDAVSASLAWLGEQVSPMIPEGLARDFVSGAVFEGLGGFLVFAPQIFVLFFVIGLLEDSGYLARAAVVCHRPLSWFGLSGRSFVPLLSGAACAIPALMSTRSIESPKKRLLTQIVVPLMVCSARLPVYTLLIGAFVPPIVIAGFVPLQGAVFFALYAFGVVAALAVSAVLSRMLKSKVEDAPFVVEMPPYRLPHLQPIVQQAWSQMMNFITKAGGMIFLVTALVWALGYFPLGQGHLSESYLARLGMWVEPVFAPLGWDWKVAVAVLTSFLAREVFVSTLATISGIDSLEAQVENFSGHVSGLTLAVPALVALMVFYAIALQCISTVAVFRKESGSTMWAWMLFLGYTVLAYAMAWFAFHLAAALL